MSDPAIAAEPIPEWEPALRTWQWAWELHWIGFGALFTTLAVYCLISLIIISNTKTKRGRLAVVITSLLFIFGVTRGLFLFINPYESEQCKILSSCPVLLSRILFGIALPCMTASFSLVHLAFLQVMKLKLYPKVLQSTKFLSCVIAVHFGLAISTEVILTMYANVMTIAIVCQSFFIIFSFLLSSSFIYSGTKIVGHVRETHTQVFRLGRRNYSEQKNADKTSERRSRDLRRFRPNVSKLVKITYITVFLGFASCALQLYSIFGVHKMHETNQTPLPKPWPWLIFQTLYRAVEFAAGCTLAYVSPRQASSMRYPLKRYLNCCQQKGRLFVISPRSDFSKSHQTNPQNGVPASKSCSSLTTQLGDFLSQTRGFLLVRQTLVKLATSFTPGKMA